MSTQAFTVGSIYNLKRESSREDLGLFQLEGPGQNPAAACVDIQWKVIVRSEAAEQPQMNVQHPSHLDSINFSLIMMKTIRKIYTSHTLERFRKIGKILKIWNIWMNEELYNDMKTKNICRNPFLAATEIYQVPNICILWYDMLPKRGQWSRRNFCEPSSEHELFEWS